MAIFYSYTYRPAIVGIAFVLLALLSACARPPVISGTQMLQANRYYEDGSYQEAVDTYQALVSGGVRDGTLFYNLGNAYFKIGDIGHAILNYLRAQRCLPRDPDVKANLTLARAQTKDRLDSEKAGFVDIAAHLLTGWLTADETASLALGLWIALCLLGTLAVLRRRAGAAMRVLMIAIALVWVVSIVSMGVRIYEARHRDPAVIVAESVEVRSGPGVQYVVEFALHDGAEVHVIETRNGWVRIALPGDLQGWTPEEAIEIVQLQHKP